ncbi:hypothetical protein H4R20_001988 [Coemansia guatemalensis]|uniref:K Homology domain-containing protein n=1 Tax=Coemansia guatemalensis TaxID=2761395 RepID=A0A9W8HY40_9FUNG|nr:hypothetical protein H4R20_001988 [Coemansia guatemalensis]
MSEGPKRFSLSDYQSKRGHARPAEAAGNGEQKNELEELHMLLGTGTAAGAASSSSNGLPIVPRTPGASPEHNADAGSDGGENEDGEDVEIGSRDSKAEQSGRSSSRRRRHRHRSDRRASKDDKSNSHRHRHHNRRHRRSSSPRSRSASKTQRRSRAHSVSCSRSRSSERSGSRRSRNRNRNRDAHRSPSQSPSRSSSPGDEISMRCVFPYEDGGIIIGLRGAHLTKLRQSVQAVDWRISNETNDRQDRILIVKGTVAHIAEVSMLPAPQIHFFQNTLSLRAAAYA